MKQAHNILSALCWILGVVCVIAGLLGHTHQFAVAGIFAFVGYGFFDTAKELGEDKLWER